MPITLETLDAQIRTIDVMYQQTSEMFDALERHGEGFAYEAYCVLERAQWELHQELLKLRRTKDRLVATIRAEVEVANAMAL